MMMKTVTNCDSASVTPSPRKEIFRRYSALLACGPLLLGAFQGHSAVVTVDATKLVSGYMNVFNLPASGSYPANPPGAYQSGSGWGLADLTSSFGGGTGNSVFLGPNQITNPDPYWYSTTTTNASGLLGNKLMDANLYNE